jgi:hypothetical protein
MHNKTTAAAAAKKDFCEVKKEIVEEALQP